MRLAVVVLFLLISSCSFGQTFDAPTESGIGIKPYRPVEHGPFRVSASVGYNLGLSADMPVAVSEIATYSFGSTEAAIGALEASGSGRVPRKQYQEFDLMYGVGFEPLVLEPDNSPMRFHLSVLTGLAFATFQERYRRRFRGAPIDTTLPPNTFEYSFGIPLRMKATYEPFRFAAIGVELFATVTKFRPSYGAGLTLQVGWF